MPNRIAVAVVAAALSLTGGCVGPAPEPVGRVQQRLDVCAVSPDGAICDDGRICTGPDTCQGGVCVGPVKADGTTCTTGDVCLIHNSQVCMAGVCKGTPAPDGYPCVDDDPCTEPDVCQAGKCISGPPKVCDDQNVCTIDSCVTGKGCMFMSIPECSPDAGVDAIDAGDAPDAGDAADAITDLMMPMDVFVADTPGMDVAMDMATADTPAMDLAPLDRPMTETPVDMSLPETGDSAPPEDRAGDLPMDQPGEAPPDVAREGGSDAPRDAGSDRGPDASGDSGDSGPDLRARGGACVCSTSDGPAGPGGVLLALLLATAIARRRR